ncbi:MAG: UDP-N-acetylmuramoyl-tripeptide--D-alanyl-D-alanine ligase [Gammaproteobacteria bacterium]|nr:UDP-N-acetylmuramoyl-tripeptide--D-alanyl-D-alanine ligase [Gammaproteobacteria bacterium]
MRGPNFDGADFLPQAAAAGAVGAVATREGPAGLATIVVDDPLRALQQAARAARARFAGPVVGVAGSNGKTTCKEMIAAILGERGATLATRGNLNNHIGVPLTLLRLEATHRHAVIEMGANRPGDVTELAGIASPGIGIVTNAGAEHLEGFGSLEGAAHAEGELLAALGRDGVAVINADDEFAGLWRDMTVARVTTFGLGAKADFGARDIRTEAGEGGFRTRFTLLAPMGEVAVTLKLAGQHNVLNALGAAAAATAAGAGLAEVAAGLARLEPVAGRLVLRAAAQGAWLIDDSYNANPSSLLAALEVLGSLEGRRWLVLGEMAELGGHAVAAHTEAGRQARAHGVERLFALGERAALAARSFGEGASRHDDALELAAAVRAGLAPDVRVLVKGSRMNRLERVVDALMPASAASRGAA